MILSRESRLYFSRGSTLYMCNNIHCKNPTFFPSGTYLAHLLRILENPWRSVPPQKGGARETALQDARLKIPPRIRIISQPTPSPIANHQAKRRVRITSPVINRGVAKHPDEVIIPDLPTGGDVRGLHNLIELFVRKLLSDACEDVPELVGGDVSAV